VSSQPRRTDRGTRHTEPRVRLASPCGSCGGRPSMGLTVR
jgi:hypothetical protein